MISVFTRILSDIRTRRVQSISIILVVSIAMFLASTSLITISSIQSPFDRYFVDLNGAHLWVSIDAHADSTELESISLLMMQR
jgi:hypothetical protein